MSEKDDRQRIRGILASMAMVPGDMESTANEIYNYLIGPNRYYHTFDHVMYMLHAYDVFRSYADEDGVFMAMAILCHDLYWRHGAPAGECEVWSANMCRMLMGKCGSAHNVVKVNYTMMSVTDLVCNAICDTAKYMGGSVAGGFARRLCDVDLASLARESYEDFVTQQQLILREAGQGTEGRGKCAAFLSEFRSKREGVFYRTEEGVAAWNARALSNIDRYIEDFGRGQGEVL